MRAALIDFQRAFASQPGGAVLDGRDIGTVIAPQAPAKLYVTATPEVRAERRRRQLEAQGEAVPFEEVLAHILKRDARDGGRETAPMAAAKDAILLDTSEMTIDRAFDAGPPHCRGGARPLGEILGQSKRAGPFDSRGRNFPTFTRRPRCAYPRLRARPNRDQDIYG